ncbi:MAG: prolipoprotein diacylglyceryl transferase [Fimbriimonadaceae bacterium]
MVYRHDLSPFILDTELFGFDLQVRWYGLAYLFGFFLAYMLLRWAARNDRIPGLNEANYDGLVLAVSLGVIIGGRLGYVVQVPFFYPDDPLRPFREDPLFPLKLNQGGMAFFGGLVGVIGAGWLYCRAKNIRFFSLMDYLAPVSLVALGLGRIANFINGELWGRPTGADWGVIFPGALPADVPRHPSTLYEMATHFILAFILWLILRAHPSLPRNRPAVISSLFLIGYGAFRYATEYFREEPFLGDLPITAAQVASLVIIALGFLLLHLALRPGAAEKAPVGPTDAGTA